MNPPPPLPPTPAPASGKSLRWLWIGLAVVLILVMIAIIAGFGWFVFTMAKRAEAGAGSPDRDTRPVTVEAIRHAPTALNRDQVSEMLDGWLDERWRRPLAAVSQPEVKDFIDKAIAWETRAAGYPAMWQTVEAADQAVLALPDGTDPLPVLRWLLGRWVSDPTERLRYLSEAVTALSEEGGDPILAWHAAVHYAMAIHQGGNQEDLPLYQAAVARALTLLDAAVAAESDFFQNAKPQLAAYALLADSGASPDSSTIRQFLEENHAEMAGRVERNQAVPEWLRHWVKSVHHIRAAWDARGSGYSNTVTEKGWQIFHAELAAAREAVEQSYRKEPTHPGPASEGITVAMGSSDEPLTEMRKWFDRSTGAQIDYERAYVKYRQGLLPRWYGNKRSLEEFGEACLEAGRFDTFQPWQWLYVHNQAAEDWDLPDYYWIELRDTAPFEKLMAGFAAEPARQPWKRFDQSMAAAFWFKCQQYDKARAALEIIELQPDARALETWGIRDATELLQKTAAFTSAAGEPLKQAEKAWIRFDSDTAATHYAEALAQGGLSDEVLAYVRHHERIAAMEAAFAGGGPVPFLPGPETHGWLLLGAPWQPEEGRLVWQGQGTGLATALARTGPSFEVTGKVRIQPGSTPPQEGAKFQVAVTYGYPEPGSRRWGSVRFLVGGPEGIVSFGRGFEAPVKSVPAPLGQEFSFRLVGRQGVFDLEIDGKPVVTKLAQTERGLVKERYAQVGIGVGTNDPGAVIELTDFSLSKPSRTRPDAGEAK
ncbi:MAG: hypothetical protein JNK37_06515 [Verrucomicrobiales bacterium]|nr:hypothetical protein [Verrucomicrobiales bacterium]